jgi:hypothetical protein
VTALAAQGHDARVFSPTPGQGNDLAATLTDVGPDGLLNTCGRLARDPGLRERLGRAARAEVECHTWDTIARTVVHLTDELRRCRN